MPFSPLDISNLKVWFDANASIFSDAGTTPCVNNDTVYQWNDLSGGNFHATQATAGSRPTFKTNIYGGKSTVHFTAKRLVTGSFLDSSFDTAITIFIVYGRTTTTLGTALSHNHPRFYVARDTTCKFYTDKLLDTFSDFDNVQRSFGVETYRYNGSQRLAQFCGMGTSEAATGNLQASGTMTIGDLSTGASPSIFSVKGDISEIIFYNRALTDAEIVEVETYLIDKYAITTTSMSFDGDSLTSGSGSTSGLTFPQQTYNALYAASGLSYAWTYKNFGVSGQTLTQMIANAATNIDPGLRTYRERNVVIVFAGTNDIGIEGVDGPTAFNRLSTYCNARRSAGRQVIVISMLPRRLDLVSPTFTADRAAFNALLTAGWAGIAEGYYNAAADTRIGDVGDNLDTTYYDVDQIHLNNTGYAIIAAGVKPLIEALPIQTYPSSTANARQNATSRRNRFTSLARGFRL